MLSPRSSLPTFACYLGTFIMFVCRLARRKLACQKARDLLILTSGSGQNFHGLLNFVRDNGANFQLLAILHFSGVTTLDREQSLGLQKKCLPTFLLFHLRIKAGRFFNEDKTLLHWQFTF